MSKEDTKIIQIIPNNGDFLVLFSNELKGNDKPAWTKPIICFALCEEEGSIMVRPMAAVDYIDFVDDTGAYVAVLHKSELDEYCRDNGYRLV